MIARILLAALMAAGALQDDPTTAANKLVEKLGSDDIASREEAVRGLKVLGESARGALEGAAQSPTKHVADWARFLIRRLDVAKRLTPAFVKARSEAVDLLASDDPHAWTEVLLESTRWTSEGYRFSTLRRSDVEVLVGPAFRNAANTKEKSDLCLAAQNWRLRSAIPEIFRYLEDTDRVVQESAVGSLGALEAVEHVDSLALLAKSGQLEVRIRSAQALVSMGARDRFPDIMKGLRSYKSSDSSPVVDAIGGLGVREELDYVVSFLEKGFALHSVLRTLGTLQARECADQVAAYLKDDFHETRSLAAEALGLMDSKKHANAVAELLGDTGVNNCAFRSVAALESIGTPELIPRVLPLVKHSFPHVRARAIRVIKTIGGKERAPDLAALLGDPDKETRIGAAVALIELGAAEHFPAILKLIADEPDGRNLSANYSNLLRSGAALLRQGLEPRDRATLLEAYRRHGRADYFWTRHPALIGLVEAGELDTAGQLALIADVLDVPVSDYSAQGLRLADALARTHEKKAWTRLNAEVDVPRTLEKPDDFKAWLQEMGFKVSWEGNQVFPRRLEKGAKTSPAKFVEAHSWRPRALYPEGDSLTLLRWDAALERWAHRLSK